MKKINSLKGSFLLIINEKKQLVGTLTDGDIRRHLLKSNNIQSKLKFVMNKKPIFGILNNSKFNEKKLKSIPLIVKFLPVLDIKKIVDHLLISSLSAEKNTDTIALIMAGGFGKRLGNKTKKTPKPLLKINNNRILDIIIKQLKAANFNKIYISTHYLHEKIEKYIGKKYKKLNIKILYEKSPMGTAGAIQLIRENFKNILVINGDIISKVNLKSLNEHHQESKNDITVTVAKYNYQIPYGIVKLTKNYGLQSINEKPILEYNVLSGVYCLNKKACNGYLEKYIDMTTLISNSLKLKHRIGVFPIYEYWKDIGNPKDLASVRNNK